jgi:hypothetical protein
MNGRPMRRFADFENGDTLVVGNSEFVKLEGVASRTNPNDFRPAPQIPAGQWCCEF